MGIVIRPDVQADVLLRDALNGSSERSQIIDVLGVSEDRLGKRLRLTSLFPWFDWLNRSRTLEFSNSRLYIAAVISVPFVVSTGTVARTIAFVVSVSVCVIMVSKSCTVDAAEVAP